jgi:hypothetical protein
MPRLAHVSARNFIASIVGYAMYWTLHRFSSLPPELAFFLAIGTLAGVAVDFGPGRQS